MSGIDFLDCASSVWCPHSPVALGGTFLLYLCVSSRAMLLNVALFGGVKKNFFFCSAFCFSFPFSLSECEKAMLFSSSLSFFSPNRSCCSLSASQTSPQSTREF